MKKKNHYGNVSMQNADFFHLTLEPAQLCLGSKLRKNRNTYMYVHPNFTIIGAIYGHRCTK